MIDLLEKELRIRGITPLEGGKFRIDDAEMLAPQAIRFFTDKANKNKSLLLGLWQELSSILSHPSVGAGDQNSQRLFIPALESLHHLASYFDTLHDQGIVDAIYAALCRDIATFSGRFMMRVVEYRLGIEWTHHLIMRDLYLSAVLRRYLKLFPQVGVTTASGVGGPWSNLDLPMQERVFEWDDIAEEMEGRTKDRQSQPRYYMGLEDYHSPRVKEGFYWEEHRRFPYDFNDEDNNPYPHRNLLWKS